MNKKQLTSKVKEIQRLYSADEKPWIIGYSGGKDSTCVLQLVYLAIKALPKEKRQKELSKKLGEKKV